MKKCSKCGEVKATSEFYARKSGPQIGELKAECKACSLAAATIWNRTHRLQQVYGITNEEYEEMYREQGGVCKICEKPEKTRRLQIDHDHETSRVRGLLCTACNTSLGRFERHLEKISEYLGMYALRDSDMIAATAELQEAM